MKNLNVQNAHGMEKKHYLTDKVNLYLSSVSLVIKILQQIFTNFCTYFSS